MTAWTSREQLGATSVSPSKLEGIVLAASSGSSAVSLTPAAWDAAVETSAATLVDAGIGAGDRVLLALTTEADGAVVLSAALARSAAAAASAGPRGRMRLHRMIESFRPDVLITTPTGAMDLLARLHMEFLVEPEDLGIQHLVVVGEIATPGSYAQLAAEFGCAVTELWCDPAYGVAVAHRHGGDQTLTVPDPSLVGLAPVDRDEIVAEGAAGPLELVVRTRWVADEVVLRTGWAAPALDTGFPVPTNTVGDLVLVRGRWVSIAALRGLFARIDGIESWSLEIRRDGTLDRGTVHVAYGRESLVGNAMWAGRVDEALRQVTPVRLESSSIGIADWTGSPPVEDHRGHHLGCDRTEVV